MKKLALGVAVSAILFNDVVRADAPLDANGLPEIFRYATQEIFLTATDSAVPLIETLLVSSDSRTKICDTFQPIYKFTNNYNQVAYYCTQNSSNPALDGGYGLLLYLKNTFNNNGIVSIIGDTDTQFLGLYNYTAICTGLTAAPVIGSLNEIRCQYNTVDPAQYRLEKPDFAISDVDPIQFRGDNKMAMGGGVFYEVTEADLAKLTVKAVAAQVFGIAVSTNLRDAMQQAQFGATSLNVGKDTVAAMPSLTQEQVSSLLTGRITSWKQIRLSTTKNLFDASTAPYKASSDRVHICRRTSGSGTQAQVGIKFMGYPCSGTTGVGLPVPPGTDIPTPLAETVNQAQVHVNSSARALGECLHELGMGTNDQSPYNFNNIYAGTTRWAIGFQSTDNNANKSQEYRYIKINGHAPTLANVGLGKYIAWVEPTFVYNNSHIFKRSSFLLKEKFLVINELMRKLGEPSVLASVNTVNSFHEWGRSGFLATPQLYNPAATGVVDEVRPVNPYSHGANLTNTNNCRMPIYYPSAGTGIQYK